MRRAFANELYKHMEKNTAIFLLVGDLGYRVFDDHFRDYPDRCINTGASEQSLLDIAVGLALKGKIPFVYSITPFLLYRPFETLRTYVNHEKIPIKLVGSGRDQEYEHDGYSHNASDVKMILSTLINITSHFPGSKEEMPALVNRMIKSKEPEFLSLSRR